MALASFTAGVLWIANTIADPTIYVGGSRARVGRPVRWEQQTWGQRLGVAGLTRNPPPQSER
ncbi:MAG TPA: hypothetical protein VH475_15930 [Tepidisphaeraceae bacterium]